MPQERPEAEAGTGPGAVAAAGDERVPPALRKLLERVPALKREPHLVVVHFAVALPMLVPLFNVLFLLRQDRRSLEKSAFYTLALSSIAAPAAIGTGLFTWWLNFKARPTRPVKIKIAVSLALQADLLAMLVWRIADEEVMTVPGWARMAYTALSLAMPGLAAALGRVGGKLSGHR